LKLGGGVWWTNGLCWDGSLVAVAFNGCGRRLSKTRRLRIVVAGADIAGAEIESTLIGWHPLSIDGHPVLGPSPAKRDVYLAIMHSGVTLAPIAGQLVARELIHDAAIGRLEPYRPTRAFGQVAGY